MWEYIDLDKVELIIPPDDPKCGISAKGGDWQRAKFDECMESSENCRFFKKVFDLYIEIEKRPDKKELYSQMSTADFEKVKKFNSLRDMDEATQKKIVWEMLNWFSEHASSPIAVAKHGEKYVIENGIHRICFAKKLGWKKIKSIVAAVPSTSC